MRSQQSRTMLPPEVWQLKHPPAFMVSYVTRRFFSKVTNDINIAFVRPTVLSQNGSLPSFPLYWLSKDPVLVCIFSDVGASLMLVRYSMVVIRSLVVQVSRYRLFLRSPPTDLPTFFVSFSSLHWIYRIITPSSDP